MTVTFDPSGLWIIVGVVVFAIVFLLAVASIITRIVRRGRSPAVDRETITVRWREIEALLKAGDESMLRHAVTDADVVFDLGMKLKFFSGKDFGGRLKMAQARYPKLRAVWPAHILRNRLVHEAGTSLSKREAERAISTFRDGLKELGLL